MMPSHDDAPPCACYRANTRLRDAAIKARYKVLHDTERLRLDDTIQRLCTEFFLAERTVWNILRRTV
jgi:hypothetical protein